jgi:hypothetical protein
VRLVKVSLSQLTDWELDDLVAAAEPTDPLRAATLRLLMVWRHERLDPPPIEEPEVYMVLR